MNVCMCGTQPGYPHDAKCPYPYYGRDKALEDQWMLARREKRLAVEETQPARAIKADDVEVQQ